MTILQQFLDWQQSYDSCRIHIYCASLPALTVFSMSHALNESKQNDINKTAVEQLELRTCAQI